MDGSPASELVIEVDEPVPAAEELFDVLLETVPGGRTAEELAEELGVLLAPADEPEVELAEEDGTPDAEPTALDVFEGEVLFGCAH